MKSLTESLDKKIDYCFRQSRGYADVAHDYKTADRWWSVYLWLKSKKEERLKAIFGA